MKQTIKNWTNSELAQLEATMSWCPKGNHQTYMYPVHEFQFTNPLGKTTNHTVLVCTCGYSFVRKETVQDEQ